MGILDDAVGQGDGSPIGPFEPGHHPEQRGLAAARRSQNGGEGSEWHLEVDAGQYGV